MLSGQQQSREELDARARRGETVIPAGTGGKSLEAQEHLAEGKTLTDEINGGSEQGRRGRSSWGQRGNQQMGRKGGLSTTEESGGEGSEREGIPVQG